MKVVMVAHECGVPQWCWNSDTAADAWVSFEDARKSVKELQCAKTAKALAELAAAPLALVRVTEALWIFQASLERAVEMVYEPEPAPTPKGAEAWEKFVAAANASEAFFSDLQETFDPSVLYTVANIDDSLLGLLEPYVSDPSLFPDALKKTLPAGTHRVASALFTMLKRTSEVVAKLVRDAQVRNCLPRIMSTESYLARELSDLTENGHASLISFGRLQCAVARVQWRTNIRAPDGSVEEDNVFFAVMSDEGESSVLLQRMALIVKEATEMVMCSVRNITQQYSSPHPGLGCVVRALLHSTTDYDSPAIPVQGVRSIIHDFTSQSSDNMLRSVEDALCDEQAEAHTHCLVFVNGKLACCHTANDCGALTSTDVFLLSAYVEGLFISKDGKSYDPGQGAAWDPNVEAESPQKRASEPPSSLASPNAPQRPLSPLSNPEVGSLGAVPTGPVKAALDNLQAATASRNDSRFTSPMHRTSSRTGSMTPSSPPLCTSPYLKTPDNNSFRSSSARFELDTPAPAEKEPLAAAELKLNERPPNELPCLRYLWLQKGVPSGRSRIVERHKHAVFVDVLGNEEGSEEAERKFSSIRVCLVEDMSGGRQADLPSMKRIRDGIRRKLAYIVDFLITVEKTHFNLVGGPAMEDCKGLVHFVVVDRTNYNRVISPRILPMRPSEGSRMVEWTAEQKDDTVRVLFPKVREMINGAQHLVSKGHTESLWGDAAVQYYHKVWVDTEDGDEVPIDPELLDIIQARPWSIRDHLAGKNHRCYELYAMYLGIIPPAVVDENNRKLLSIILPSRNKSFD
eukprot:Rhum_TRINITY_DN7077_c1_g1::Rhum_TRINITY_DN7077_c1_g1_i1::g.21676::m.21676